MVVASKVKQFVKDQEDDFRVSAAVAEALEARVELLLKDAIVRAQANGRKTIKAWDL